MKRDRIVEAIMLANKIIADVDGDERYHYRCATIIENLPLALEQLSMETRIELAVRFKRILTGKPQKVPPSRRGQKKVKA